jgi:hypothetical protein
MAEIIRAAATTKRNPSIATITPCNPPCSRAFLPATYPPAKWARKPESSERATKAVVRLSGFRTLPPNNRTWAASNRRLRTMPVAIAMAQPMITALQLVFSDTPRNMRLVLPETHSMWLPCSALAGFLVTLLALSRARVACGFELRYWT